MTLLRRRMTRHFSHIFLTDGLTFMDFSTAGLQAYHYSKFCLFLSASIVIKVSEIRVFFSLTSYFLPPLSR